jgi:hypothetical protein
MFVQQFSRPHSVQLGDQTGKASIRSMISVSSSGMPVAYRIFHNQSKNGRTESNKAKLKPENKNG